LRKSAVGESHRLQPPHPRSVIWKPLAANLGFRIDDLLQPLQEPRIKSGNLVDPLDREALPKRLRGD